MRFGWALAVAVLLLGSGCLSASGKTSTDTSTDPSDGSSTPPLDAQGPTGPPRTSPRPSGSNPSTSSSPSPGGGSTEPPQQTQQTPWPAMDKATIRPGVQITMAGAQCTTNFVFRSPDNSTLYVGLAAHCVKGMKLGDPLSISGAHLLKLAYSSWLTLGLTNCDGESDPPGCDEDFALARIDAADRDKVHPAMLHYGGPISLADSSGFALQQKLLFYGNSDLHMGFENANWHDGVVSSVQSGPQFRMVSLPPGVPGDSGSGVLTKDGHAAGIFVNICIAPCPGQQGVVGLKAALETASKKAKLDVELATWAQLDDGLLP